MDKRTTLALLLTMLVIIAPMIFFPKPPPEPPVPPAGAAGAPGAGGVEPVVGGRGEVPVSGAVMPVSDRELVAAPGRDPSAIVPVDTVRAEHGRAHYTYLSPHAVPARVSLLDYRNLSPGGDGNVSVVSTGAVPLLRYRLLLEGRDTVAVESLPISASVDGGAVRFESATPPFRIEYTPTEKSYLLRVSGSAPPGATALLIDLPHGLESFEADTVDDQRHNAYGYKPFRDAITSVSLSKLDTLRGRTDLGPMQWVVARNKYFLVALVAPDSARGFDHLWMRGGHRDARGAATGMARTAFPISGGSFAFDLYVGPQSWQRLKEVGGELENVNPYAGWAHNLAQPFVTIVMRMLLWLKGTLQVNYGWVLVIFGVIVRLLMWPLSQGAMRSSIKMQRLQPELQAIQKRYKDDPDAQRKALMKVYQDHGMNPLSPLLGCLPMLLPMPVFFALYFVFQNTIEFRGVPFLWLPDLSIRDPLYIAPLLMGGSMLLMSWIGMRNAPPNPQAKVMGYMLPAMFIFFFLNFASGLNLYYAVQNFVAIPQQWLLARERLKAAKT